MSSQTIVGKLAIELGISDDKLQAGLAQAVAASQAAGQKMANAVNQGASKATSGGAKNAMGLLNLSRAIDDVQYGFRGIVNNIEGIVTGFGMSAGVAGAATIAAVAINMLLPKIMELASTKDPIRDLADSIKSISNSGLQGTFAGFSAEAKATQAALEASIDILEKMQQPRRQVVFAAAGPGMGAAPVGQIVGDNLKELFDQRMRVNNLAQEAASDAFRANQEKQRIAMGGLSGMDRTSSQEEQTKINQQLFQSAVDKFGGGKQLFDALKMKDVADASIFGAFKEGDLAKSEKAVDLLGLQAESAKLMADAYERATGSALELNRIETDRLQKDRRNLSEQFGAYEQGVAAFDRLSSRRSLIESNMNRSEILGSAAEVFGRNINAGMEDPQLKELREIKEEIRNLQPLTGLQ